MDLSFKKIGVSDLEPLILISRQTYYAAFSQDNTPENMEDYLSSAFSESKMRAELSNPNSTFFFVYHANMLVGYLKLNKEGTSPDLIHNNGLELERIYVLSTFQGKGIGKIMLQYVVDTAKAQNVTSILLGVWSQNYGAIKFYERYGFEKVGQKSFWMGEEEQMDYILRLELR